MPWSKLRSSVDVCETPFFVFSPAQATSAFEKVKEGLREWGPGSIAFSIKTNPFFGLLSQLTLCGAWAEVVSRWEYDLARSAGFRPDQIIVNGPLKTSEDLRTYSRTPPRSINIDNLRELDVLETIDVVQLLNVGLRICPPASVHGRSRFGLLRETGEVAEAIERILANPNFELACLHFHIRPQNSDIESYLEMLDQIQEIWALHQLSGEVMVDIGGGFPYQHEVPFEDQSFQPVAFFQKLAGAWKLPTKPHLVVEPGRFIAAPSMMLVSTVLATKHRPEATLVVLDSGTNLLPIASEFNHLIHFPETAGHSEPFVICGPLCSEEDVFAGLYQAPIPDAGCIVVISNAGAYSVALASTFIQPRPPILTLGESDSLSLTVNRETMEQAYALVSTLPPKLLEEEEGGVR